MSAARRGRTPEKLRVVLEAAVDAAEVESILHHDFWRVPARSPRRPGVPGGGLRLVSTSERLMS